MTRHPFDQHSSSPAVQRARDKLTSSSPAISRISRDVNAPGGVRIDLDVKVADLEDIGTDVKETLPTAWVSDLLDDGKSPRWMGAGDASLNLHLDTEASFVRVKGQGRFLLSHPCVRCLNDVPFDVRLDVDLRLVEKVEGPIEGAWGEGDADGDDFEGPALGDASDLEDISIASYQDGVVKVRDLLREQLFLELPMHPACDSRDARPERACAFDENSANATERAGWTTSRWASLATLRDKLPAGPAGSTRSINDEVKKMTQVKHELPKPEGDKPTTTASWKKAQASYADKSSSEQDTQLMPVINDDSDDAPAAQKATAATDDDGEVTALVAIPGAMPARAPKKKPAAKSGKKKASSKKKPAKKSAKKKASSKKKPAKKASKKKASSKKKPAKKASKKKASAKKKPAKKKRR